MAHITDVTYKNMADWGKAATSYLRESFRSLTTSDAEEEEKAQYRIEEDKMEMSKHGSDLWDIASKAAGKVTDTIKEQLPEYKVTDSSLTTEEKERRQGKTSPTPLERQHQQQRELEREEEEEAEPHHYIDKEELEQQRMRQEQGYLTATHNPKMARVTGNYSWWNATDQAQHQPSEFMHHATASVPSAYQEEDKDAQQRPHITQVHNPKMERVTGNYRWWRA